MVRFRSGDSEFAVRDPNGYTLVFGEEPDAAARLLHTYDWVVVTSANGARAILKAAERVFTALETPRWAAIGAATGAVLEHEGIDVVEGEVGEVEVARGHALHAHGPRLDVPLPRRG